MVRSVDGQTRGFPVSALTAASPEGGQFEVVLRNVSHYYGRNQVLSDVSLAIGKGEFFGLLGPSGSGKSTTLRIIGGFIFPTSGDVYIDGEMMGRTPPYRRNTTMVFQHLALFPHMTVFDNLAYGLKLRKVGRDEIKARVAKALEIVHLGGFQDRFPKQLSGGQQQRVALARALIMEPGVVLFDEPLGSLDLKLRREMQVEIKGIQRSLGKTFIYVTHDQQEAMSMCDRIAVMNEGRVAQVGTADEIYERPNTRFVADFIGDANLLDGRVVAVEEMTATIESGGAAFKGQNLSGFAVGDRALLCIRPERIVVGTKAMDCSMSFPARLVDAVYTGALRRCSMQLTNGAKLKVDLDAKTTYALSVGEQVVVGWEITDAYLVSP